MSKDSSDQATNNCGKVIKEDTKETESPDRRVTQAAAVTKSPIPNIETERRQPGVNKVNSETERRQSIVNKVNCNQSNILDSKGDKFHSDPKAAQS